MNNAQAALSHGSHETAMAPDRLELAATLALFGVGAFLQLSIAVSQALLAIAVACWLGVVLSKREPFRAPQFFWPLLAYAAWTLVSAAFSANREHSLIDCKQLVLFLLVPITYRLMTAQRAATMITVIVSVGGASAAVGIFEYGLLHYNQLGNRPPGLLGHYMTYSGLLMLVVSVAMARLLFGTRERLWPALVMPALLVALALTLSRSAWIGSMAAVALLFTLKDFRLLAILPIVAMIVFAAAPSLVSRRMASMLDPKDATRRDRVAMLREGVKMVRDHPLVGVGPDMVQQVYAAYREPDAVQDVNPHLHNVPMQIAAERGLPALAIWLVFLVVLCRDLLGLYRSRINPMLTIAALACIVAMFVAGLLEYNFGDSEFLMMLLIVVTLPFAAAPRPDAAAAAA